MLRLLKLNYCIKMYAVTFLLLAVIYILSSCEQPTTQRSFLGKTHAEEQLKLTLSTKPAHNIVDSTIILIKDSVTAIQIAEPILFSIYGREAITKQQPYECYFIDNYWLLCGTLRTDELGGTFLIIMDSRNGEIVRITHGK
jgi:NTF2 fold immunity protein